VAPVTVTRIRFAPSLVVIAEHTGAAAKGVRPPVRQCIWRVDRSGDHLKGV